MLHPVVWNIVPEYPQGCTLLPAPLCKQQGRQGCQAGTWSMDSVRSACRGRYDPASAMTHPSGFALVLHCFFGVRHSPLHVVHRVFHVVLNAVNHLTLQSRDRAHTPMCTYVSSFLPCCSSALCRRHPAQWPCMGDKGIITCL